MAVKREDPYENVQTHTGPFCHEPGFRGYGNIKDGVMFLGIAPGRDEVKSGRPLTGPSGQLLNSFLRAIEFPRSRTYATNMICWWKDEPTHEDYMKCKARLEQEIAEVKPRLIILMGALVTEYILGRKLAGNIGSRGSVTWHEGYHAYIMPTYHPAAVLRGQGKESYTGDKGAGVALDIWRDLSKIKDIITWPQDNSLQKCNYVVVESIEQAQQILNNLPSNVPVAVDVETTNPSIDEIDVVDDELLCLSIATPSYCWVFPRYTLDGLKWPIDRVRWTFHNGMFDTQVIKKHLGFWLPIVEDTMLQSYSLDERPGYHRLKPLAREYNGAGWWEEERKAHGKKMHLLPPKVLHRYNAHDGYNTAILQSKLETKQIADDVRKMYLELLIPAANVFNRIQYHGIKVDALKLQVFEIKYGIEVIKRDELVQQLAVQAGWPEDEEFNPSSSKQVNTVIYDLLGLPLGPRKVRSTDKENLNRLKGVHPFVDALSDYRIWSKYYSTYVTALLGHIKKDGRAHAVPKLHGTVTGRRSYTNPPLQTIPRPYDSDEEWAKAFGRMRSVFMPTDDDHVIIEADFGKAEIWMAHYYSGDEQILADLLSGDYHTQVSMDVLNKQRHEVTKDDRTDMKRVTFGVMYGREEYSLSLAINKSITEAAAYIQGYFNRNKQYAQFLTQTQRQAMQNGELVTITGRKRRFMFLGENWDHRALKQAINYPIQSTTGDYTLASVIELYPLLEKIGAYITMDVHDSIVVDCPKAVLEQACKIIHDVMTKPRWFGGLPVEIKVGKSWGLSKPVHSCEDKGECQETRRYDKPGFYFKKSMRVVA